MHSLAALERAHRQASEPARRGPRLPQPAGVVAALRFGRPHPPARSSNATLDVAQREAAMLVTIARQPEPLGAAQDRRPATSSRPARRWRARPASPCTRSIRPGSARPAIPRRRARRRPGRAHERQQDHERARTAARPAAGRPAAAATRERTPRPWPAARRRSRTATTTPRGHERPDDHEQDHRGDLDTRARAGATRGLDRGAGVLVGAAHSFSPAAVARRRDDHGRQVRTAPSRRARGADGLLLGPSSSPYTASSIRPDALTASQHGGKVAPALVDDDGVAVGRALRAAPRRRRCRASARAARRPRPGTVPVRAARSCIAVMPGHRLDLDVRHQRRAPCARCR